MKPSLQFVLVLLLFFGAGCSTAVKTPQHQTATELSQIETSTVISEQATESSIEAQATRILVKETAGWEATQTEAVMTYLRNATRTAMALTPSPKPYTLTPSATPTATPTSTPFLTFNPQDAVTHTPAPPAQCPEEDPQFEVQFGEAGFYDYDNWVANVQAALDQGASLQQVADAASKMYKKEYGGDVNIFPLLDLNGDGVEELIVYRLLSLYAFGCADGKYRIILDYYTDDGAQGNTKIVSVEDMNMNGTPEVVIAYAVTTGSNVQVDILEWNGSEFVSLVLYDFGEDAIRTNNQVRALYWYGPRFESYSLPTMNFWTKIEITDLDHNGTKELILTDGGHENLYKYLDTGPWRGQQKVLTWDGMHFRYSGLELAPPQYRFQAVNDADRLFLLGDYERALALYQDVIFSDELGFWSAEMITYLIHSANAKANNEPMPTMPAPDPNEYLSLSAYTRYRILLHHLAQGWVQDAAIVYAALRAEHLAGTAGYPYAEMAMLLWAAYQNSEDLSAACQPVITYVEAHPEILDPLGNASFFGFQVHEYIPRDICPFE